VTNETHDSNLRSWVESANAPTSDFPIQNLPFGVFQSRRGGEPHVGAAIGDRILDLRICRERERLGDLPARVQRACSATILNPLIALEPLAIGALRRRLIELLRADAAPEPELLVAGDDVTLLMPLEVGGYTDFYASISHATNVGRLFRPDAPLLPNYKHVPIAYHGRTSSLVVSGTAVRRPWGQIKTAADASPSFEPSRRLDYETEIAAVIGTGNRHGEPIALDDAERHVFGLCLLNDWSARDIQAWEYQPLGPFLGKNFATSLSPWLVTMEALAPFRCAAFERPAGDPAPLPYLASPHNDRTGGFDITVEALLQSADMRRQGLPPVRLGRGSLTDMYWTVAQMVTHHSSNGCPLETGDVIASGTVSGASEYSHGCLLEITRGSQPLGLPTGEERLFLAAGDELTLHAFCERPGRRRIGFGTCSGVVLPAHPPR
jgi:fumarylacetoacetase